MAEIATNRTSSSDYSGEFFLFFSPWVLPFVWFVLLEGIFSPLTQEYCLLIWSEVDSDKEYPVKEYQNQHGYPQPKPHITDFVG